LCHNCYSVKWRQAHASQTNAYNKAYRHANPEKVAAWEKSYRGRKRDYLRRLKMDVSQEQLESTMKRQKGRCALCHWPFGKEIPAADHDHKTRRFRGFIHRNCNLGLGFFHDDIKRLSLAIQYLKKFTKRRKA